MREGGKLSNQDRRFLELAESLARTSESRAAHHGAVLVLNGNVIAVGVNKDRNRPGVFDIEELMSRHSSIHAEIACLGAVKGSPRRGVMYVARVRKDGKTSLSRPCKRCWPILEEAGIKRVVYT